MDTQHLLMEATAEALRAANSRPRLTHEAIAKRAGMSRMTVFRLFNARRVADLSQLAAIAKALEISAETLVSDIFRRSSELENAANVEEMDATRAGLPSPTT